MHHWWESACPTERPQCRACDPRSYWPQFARLYETFAEVVAREEALRWRYAWLVRLRTDLRYAGQLLLLNRLSPAAGWAHRYGTDAIFTGHPGQASKPGVTTSCRASSVLLRDYFAIVPRGLAAAYVRVADSFARCQSRELNAVRCQCDWWTQECIYTRYLEDRRLVRAPAKKPRPTPLPAKIRGMLR